MRKVQLTIVLFALFWAIFLILSKLESVNYFLGIDLRVQNLAVAFRFLSALEFFKLITFLGSWQFILSVTVLISFLLWKYKKFKYLFPLLLSVFGSYLANLLLKEIFQKQRPIFAAISESSFSFPSTHAVLSIVFYGLIVYFLLINLKRRSLKVLVVFLGIILIFLIDFSRIYLTVHFYSDVLAGFFHGAIWLMIGILFFKNFNFKKIIVFCIGVVLINSLFFLFLPHVTIPQSLKTVKVNNPIAEFNKKLPKFTQNLNGANQQPISFFIIAKNDQELINLFADKGWVLTERLSFQSLIKLAKASDQNKSYPKGFITPGLWNNMVQDFSFAKQTPENTIRIRHHCRFWKTNIETQGLEKLYVGYCSFDKGVKAWLVTHKIDPNIDKEREYLFKDIQKSGQIKSFEKINLVSPFKGRTFQGDYFYTNGEAYLIELF